VYASASLGNRICESSVSAESLMVSVMVGVGILGRNLLFASVSEFVDMRVGLIDRESPYGRVNAMMRFIFGHRSAGCACNDRLEGVDDDVMFAPGRKGRRFNGAASVGSKD